MDYSEFHDHQTQRKNAQRTPNHQSRDSPHLKSLDFLEKYKGNENQAIKAFNHVQNKTYKPLIDSPELVSYIIEAMKDCNNDKENLKSGHPGLEKSGQPWLQRSGTSSPQLMKVNSSRQASEMNQKYKINNERRQLQKLNSWLIEKLKEQKWSEKKGASFITERINCLHLVFSELCRYAGKYSQPLGETYLTVHSEYHDFYQQLIENFMKQNRVLKNKQSELQNKLNSVINHYERELLNIRAEYQKKSSKVIENFHKCINMKQEFENEAKKLATALKLEKNKLQYVEEGLAEAISILLEIGNEKFKFLSNEQEKAILSLGKDLNSCPENYKLFHKWCSTIIHSILAMKNEKQEGLKNKTEDNYLRKFALTAIGKYMIDFDPTLSMRDIEEILNQYAPTYSPKMMMIPIDSCTQKQEKFKIIKRKVPNLQEISEKFFGKDMDVQTGIMLSHESKETQAAATTQDISVTAKPRDKAKETSTLSWIREKMKIMRQIDEYIWAEKLEVSKQKHEYKNKVKTQEVIMKIVEPAKQNSHIIRRKSKIGPMVPASLPVAVRAKPESNLQVIIPEERESSIREMGENKEQTNISLNVEEKSKRRVNLSSRKSKRVKNVKFSAANQREQNEGAEKQRDQESFNQIQIKSITSLSHLINEDPKREFSKTMNFIENSEKNYSKTKNEDFRNICLVTDATSFQHLKRRRGAISNELNTFISDIVNRRSLKNLQKNEKCSAKKIQEPKAEIKENILLGLIKVPEKILKNQSNIAGFRVHKHMLTIQLIEKLQEKVKILTKSTMWHYKKTIEIEKMSLKAFHSKQKICLDSNQLENLLAEISHYIEPILSSFLKTYSQLVEFDNSMSSNSFKQEQMMGRKITYYHRLAPLINLLINSYSSFGMSRAMKATSILHKSFKIFKTFEPKLEIFQELLEGSVVELDVFTKIVYHWAEDRKIDFFSQTIPLKIIEIKLFFIIDFYLSPIEINALISSIRTLKKETNRKSNDFESQQQLVQEKVYLGQVCLKIFKAIKHKKFNLRKKYHQILKYLSEGKDYVTFNDLVYFIEVLPINPVVKRKIIFQSSFYFNYWNQKEPMIPVEMLIFVFDGLGIQVSHGDSAEKANRNILNEYFRDKCENEYRKIYEKISHRPEYVVESVYRLFYKVPPMVYRLTQEAKFNKNKQNNIILLTILYNKIIEQQIQRIYVPGLLNAFTCIPLAF